MMKRYETTKRLLEVIWDKILLRGGIAVSNGGNSYEISCKKIKISAPKQAYICSKCKKITSHNVENVCPSIIAVNKETSEILAKNLKSADGKFELVFTRNEQGRKELFKCRKYSYIMQTARL